MNIKMNWAFHSISKNYDVELKGSDNDNNIVSMEYEGNFDEDIYNLLSEVHCVIGLQNIAIHNSNQINNNVDNQIRKLKSFDKYHCDLMYLKKVLYNEVKERLQNINFQDIDDLEKNVYIHSAYRPGIYVHLHEIYKYIILLLSEYSDFNKNSYTIISVLHLIGKIMNNKYYYKEDKLINIYLKIAFELKDKNLNYRLQVIGFLFLVESYRILCHGISDFDAKLSAIEFVQKFDRYTVAKQSRIQNDLVMCYQVNNELFYDEFKDRLSKFCINLEKYTRLRKRYIEQNSCFATMIYNGKQYYSLSGSMDYENKISRNIQFTKSLENEGYERIKLNKKNRYYYSDTEYITHNNFGEYITDRVIDQKEKDEMKRLFSCCEKKFLVYLYEQPKESEETEFKTFQMFVKYKPCKMCERALNDYDKNYVDKKVVNEIIIPRDMEKDIKIEKYDELAIKIKEGCGNY